MTAFAPRPAPELLEQLSATGSFAYQATGESWWSPYLHRLLGLDPTAVPASQAAFLHALHADDAAVLAQLFATLAPGEDATLDCRTRVPSGISLRLEVTCRCLSGGLLVGVVRDVSDARHLEDLLRQSESHAPIGVLTAGVVHDVNNLIAAATLNLSLARRMAGGNVPLKRTIDDADGALRRAGQLARHLLDEARPEHHQGALLDVSDVVRGVESLMRCVLPRRIELVVEAPPAAGQIDLDPLQLERVLINLVLNARDAIPGDGSIAVTVAVVEPAAAGGPTVLIEVADTGRGMEPFERDAVLAGPFSTRPGGHGLGVAVVRSVLEQVGGTMSLDTAPGAGTRFTLTLPVWARRRS